MVAASYGIEEAKNKRFIIHGPEGILFHEAEQLYCNVLHPEIKKVSTMPYWLANIISVIKNQEQIKIASDFMAAFEKIGELRDPSETNKIFGSPEIKLNDWLKQKLIER